MEYPNNLKYPEDLDTSPKYGNQFVSFNIMEISGKTRTENFARGVLRDARGTKIRSLGLTSGGSISPNNKNTVASIYLPIPNKISTNYGVQYEEIDFGTEAAKIAGSAVSSVLGGVSKAASALGGTAAFASALLGSDAVRSAAGTAAAAAGKRLELAINPHKELLFKGVKLRTFDFSWKLIARNKPESDNILNISNSFRAAMHPELNSKSLLYKYPSEFDIEFWKIEDNNAKPNNFLTFVGPCVLQDSTVNYSGGGEYVSFKETSAPVEVELTLKFQETVVITKDLLKAVQ